MQRLRRRRLKRALLAIVGILLIYSAGYAGYTFAHSPFFDLNEIRVQGNAIVHRDELVALSGLRIGVNLLSVSTEQAEEGIRSQPYIKDAVVTRSFPNRVDVRVSERTPIALISGGGRYLILDENGHCLLEVGLAGAESWRLPSIRCSDEAAAIGPGDQTDDEGVLAALTLIKKLDPFFLENILEFEAFSAERLAVINTDGLPVYFGLPEDLDRKLQDYEDVLIRNREKCNAATLNYVDIRYDTQITLNWK
ncbi:MAG: FtsQ-type POTRA domain-containing protein [Peptococcaceae bacterium]|jgi:cell division protein FtsQ|nr:FtsQ-type POTRA domain-containing protein [Peptococcaceae bacterium]